MSKAQETAQPRVTAPGDRPVHVLIKDRLDKLAWIKSQGIDPYPYSFNKTWYCGDLQRGFESLKPEEKRSEHVRIAGRIMSFRKMGKVSFCTVQDQSGRVQAFFRYDDLGEKPYELMSKCDIGDVVGVVGEPFKTKSGELSVHAKEFHLLSKSIRPLPEKFHGLVDTETRYRKRYLDLIMNPEVKGVFVKRSRIIDAIRNHLNGHGFLEVDTPILHHNYGGANARPFKSKLNALDMDVYLRIADELHLKRLQVGGFEKIYEFAKDFRNEGIDRTHNPEFMQIEIYQAWVDYTLIMQLIEHLFRAACRAVNGTEHCTYGDHHIDFSQPFRRITMRDAIKEYANIDVDKLTDEELFDLRITYNLEIKCDLSRGVLIMALFEELVEDKLISPTYVIEHPVESTPLCKPSRAHKGFVERAELFVAGFECANIYSELNDPLLQRKLLEDQATKLRAGSEEAHPMDEDFIEAIEYGMPPMGGVGFGIDRLTMLLTNSHTIKDVILFPFMKPEEK
ncbi:lysine--tRNA ligase [Candidatus Woesearchaeota archaeon]|nr:lysine--tRNA ligase [Candidatus Woesearchaeota archaeon]